MCTSYSIIIPITIVILAQLLLFVKRKIRIIFKIAVRGIKTKSLG